MALNRTSRRSYRRREEVRNINCFARTQEADDSVTDCFIKSDDDVVYIEMLSKHLGPKHTVLSHATIYNFNEHALRQLTVYQCIGPWWGLHAVSADECECY